MISTSQLFFKDLVYPDFQQVLESNDTAEQAIKNYLELSENLLDKYEAYFPVNDETVPNKKIIFGEFIKLQKRYLKTYEEFMVLEKKSKKSGMIAFFNKLESTIKEELDKKSVAPLCYTSYTRFKAWYSFVQKCLTKCETMNYESITSYHDILAMKFVLHTFPSSLVEDYDSAIDECYTLLNCVAEIIISLGGELIPLSRVGMPDERVNELFRSYVKDYIKNPKHVVNPETGKEEVAYQALHIAFKMEDGRKFEIQICSLWMASTARDHEDYKSNSKIELPVDENKIRMQGFCGKSFDVTGIFKHKEITKQKNCYIEV